MQYVTSTKLHLDWLVFRWSVAEQGEGGGWVEQSGLTCVLPFLQAVQCEGGRREVVRAAPVGGHRVDAVAVSYKNVP